MNPRTPLLEAEPQPHVAPAARATLFSLTLFWLGHFFVDLYSGALGALQPLLVDQFRMSFTAAGILAGVLSFSSSVMQPAYGYLSDRFHSRLFTALAPAMAGLFISSLVWAPNFRVLLSLVLVAFLRPPTRASHSRVRFDWGALRAVRSPMTILFFLVFIRSIVQITFTQMLPLYLHSERGYSLGQSSFELTLYLAAGAIGGLAGGNLADRFGGRRVILISMLGSVPF